MTTSLVSLDISANGADLNITVRCNDQVIYQGNPNTTVAFEVGEAGEHVLEIELAGKLPEHTQLDAQGNILQDQLITVNNLKFDDIELGQVFYDLAEYHHDLNGTSASRVDKFYGTMGCNGVVRLKFSCPVYIWLLENM